MADIRPVIESSPDTSRKCLTSRGRKEVAYPPNLRQNGEQDIYDLHQVRPPEEAGNNFFEASFDFALSESRSQSAFPLYNSQWARASDMSTNADEDLSTDFGSLSVSRSETLRDETTASNAGVNRHENDSSPHFDQRHGNSTSYAPSTSAVDTQHRYNWPENYMYPMMASYEVRLQTFINWPLSEPRGQDLADANMFYQGAFYEAGEIVSDQVVCYKCGQTFRQWQPDDDPVKEHMRIYIDCFNTKWVEEL